MSSGYHMEQYEPKLSFPAFSPSNSIGLRQEVPTKPKSKGVGQII